MSAADDFADGRFKIECSEMVLTKAGTSPLTVRGPGEIWQDEDGVLRYKIFVGQTGYRDLRAHMSRPRAVGQIIPDDEFFTLEAQEPSLPIWTAPRVLPGVRGGIADGLAYGDLYELVHADQWPGHDTSDYVTLSIREKLNFPCNQGTETVIRVGGQDRRTSSELNAAFIEDGEFRFELVHEGEHTLVSLQLPAGQLNPSTPKRIHESLQFVLGRQLAVMVVSTSSGNQSVTRLTSPARGHGRMPPPLLFHRFDQGGHVWRIFTSYFRYVHPNTNLGWHPVSHHVGSVVQSTAASLEAEVLALAVAVEGLAGECFPAIAPVSPTFLAELDAVQAALQSVTLTANDRNRVNGTINAMRSPRNSDVIRAFIANNHLPAGLFESWRRLRNPSTHGGGIGGRDIETTLQLKFEVLSLLYSLVLAAINYTGPRTDYSIQGWPVQPWPVPPPAPVQPPPPATGGQPV